MSKKDLDGAYFIIGAFVVTWLIILSIFGVFKLAGYLFDVPCSAFASREEQKGCGL